MTSAPARVTRVQYEALNGHRGGVVYFTGLSGAGKTTLAVLLEHRMHRAGLHTCLLDGDELRTGLCGDLGYSDADRVENMRRVIEVARVMVNAGLVVITALIAPFRAERAAARASFAPGDFVEVFVDAPLRVCEARDPKGLYRRARSGEIAGFTGIDSAYEPPLAPDFRIDAALWTPHRATSALWERLRELRFLQGRERSRCASSVSTPSGSMPGHTPAGAASAGPSAGKRFAQR